MAPEALTYAIVGGPPEEWRGLEIVDIETGQKVDMVIEVNTLEGWLIRYKTDDKGSAFLDGDQAARERIEGRFQIRRPEGGATGQ